MVYRSMQAADIPALQLLLPGLLPGNWTQAGLEELLASTHQGRVLETRATPGQSRLLGFAEFQLVLDECHLLGIGVVQAWQGRGLGKLLLQALLQEAVVLGARTCLLEVRRSNAAAVRLYVSRGFELTGLRTNYYPAAGLQKTPEDALLYSLGLS